MCVPNILPDSFVIYDTEECPSLGDHSTGPPVSTLMTTHEDLTTTLLFTRSDRPVYSPVSIGPFSPCHPTQAVAGPIFSHIRNPCPAFPGEVHHFHGVWIPSECLELKVIMLALQHWVSVLQGHQVMIAADNHCCSLSTNRVGPIPTPCCGW